MRTRLKRGLRLRRRRGVMAVLTAGVLVSLVAPAGATLVLPASTGTASAQDAPGQEPRDDADWIHEPLGIHPPDRAGGSMASDSTGRVVLFGGMTDQFGVAQSLNDTWTWDGTTWTLQQPPVSPPARQEAAMAFHPASGKVVLFGGWSTAGGLLSDTWTWDGTTNSWIQEHPAEAPSARRLAALARHANDRLVLFGGQSQGSAGPVIEGDTWTWDGTWHREDRESSPPARYAAAAAYHSPTGRLVLFGGVSTSDLGDTWTWDGENWSPQDPDPHPSPRHQAAMAEHEAFGQLVLFGGAASPNPGDTWTWDGSAWIQRHPGQSAPDVAFRNGMAYHAPTQRVLVLEGLADTAGLMGVDLAVTQPLGDTWTWDGVRKVEVSPPDPDPSVPVLSLEVNPKSIPADGKSSATVVAKVVSSDGSVRMGGKRIDFIKPDENHTLEPNNCLTGPDGTCSITVRSDIYPGDKKTIEAFLSEAPTPEPPWWAWTSLAETAVACQDQLAPPRGPDDWWGNLDFSFGCHDMVRTKPGPGPARNGHVTDMVLEPDGRIVVGRALSLPGAKRWSELARFGTHGAVDTSFGTAGTTPVEGDIVGLARQPDGKLVALLHDVEVGPGGEFNVEGRRHFARVMRVNPDGSPDDGSSADTTRGDRFGADGTTTVGARWWPADVALQPDGRIVMTGYPDGWDADVPLRVWAYRLNRDGSLDEGFGGDGAGRVTLEELEPSFGTPVVTDPEGKIVVGGSSNRNFAVVRLLADNGDLDPRFNPCSPANTSCGGMAVTSFGAPSSLLDLALGSDGAIVAAGESGGSFAVASGPSLK